MANYSNINTRRIERTTNCRCAYCGCDLDWRKNPDVPTSTYDHKIPKSRGGAHCEDNLVLSCGSCNSRKGTKTVSEFRGHYKERPTRLIKMIDEMLTAPYLNKTQSRSLRARLRHISKLFKDLDVTFYMDGCEGE